MKARHTPGPWRVKRSTEFWLGQLKEYYWVGAGPIGDETPVVAHSLEENEANARLIASAPDLLRAAKNTLAWLEQFVGPKAWTEIRGEPHTDNLPVPEIDELFLAIAKTEGSAQWTR